MIRVMIVIHLRHTAQKDTQILPTPITFRSTHTQSNTHTSFLRKPILQVYPYYGSIVIQL